MSSQDQDVLDASLEQLVIIHHSDLLDEEDKDILNLGNDCQEETAE